MDWLRRLFGINIDEPQPSELENEQESEAFLTFEDAKALAESEAKRDLQIGETAITYVKYDENFQDYIQVEILFAERNKGVLAMSSLPLEERQSDEQLNDQHIAYVARTGNLIGAIRLYRLLHTVGLKEAKDAIDRLLKE